MALVLNDSARPHLHISETGNIHPRKSHGAEALRIYALQTDALYHIVSEDR